MKYFELTKEEKEILNDFDKGEFKSSGDIKGLRKIYSKYAKNTLNKSRSINIRISEKVLAKIKSKALEEGIPYQTLISSLLHKHVMG